MLTILFFINSKYASNDVVETSLKKLGDRRYEFEKVIAHYENSKENLKLKAAIFLIKSLPYQTFEELIEERKYDSIFTKAATLNDLRSRESLVMSFLDTFNNPQTIVRYDYEVIDSKYLIKNIDLAFAVWNLYDEKIGFDEFCEFILPYKTPDDKPCEWRENLMDEYKWVIDSLKSEKSTIEACNLVNGALRKKFVFRFAMNKFPVIMPYSLMRKNKFGICRDFSNYTTYCMRAIGLPVTIETTKWASRSIGHEWNSILWNKKMIPFLGGDVDPFLYKVENELTEYNRRSKVFRKMFAYQIEKANTYKELPITFKPFQRDVSKELLAVCDIKIQSAIEKSEIEHVYLCTYDNLDNDWIPVTNGTLKGNMAHFEDIGKNNCYLPVLFKNGIKIPISQPFVLDKKGEVNYLCREGTFNENTIKLYKKYPFFDSNNIKIGDNYELFFWNGSFWESLGKQNANDAVLVYQKTPLNALFLLKNLDRGNQERIFTYENNKQIWW